MRSLKIRVGKSNNGKCPVRPYVYSKQMAFLRNKIQSQAISDNVSESSISTSENEEVQNVDVQTADDEDYQQLGGLSVLPAPSIVKPDPPLKRRRNTPDYFETEISDILQVNVSTPATSFPLKNVLQYNEEDKMFLISLLPHMQEMSSIEKFDFKINVLQLLRTSALAKEREGKN